MRPLLPDAIVDARRSLTIQDGSDGGGGAAATPIDLAQAEARFGGPDRWARLLAIYLEDTAERIQKIAAAIESRDLETVRKEAHSVKGASAQIHAEPMRDVSAAAEQAARDGLEDDAYAKAARMAPEFERFRAHVGG